MALLVGAMFLPVVSSSTTRTVAHTETNDDVDWLTFNYATTENYAFEISVGADSITVGTQTGELMDMMVYACSDFSLIVVDGKIHIAYDMGWENLGTSISVLKDANGLSINGGEPMETPAWAYYPSANGQFAHYSHGDLLTDGIKPLATWGYFAGVLTYNDVLTPYDLSMSATITDNVIDSVEWVIVEPEEILEIQPFNPDDVIFEPIDLDPLNPGVIDPIDPGENTIQSADPQNGTRVGDLYYTFTGTNATVIGYASTIDWGTFTTIPDTVESGGVTYTVFSIGDSAFSGCSNLALTSLPSGLIYINNYAFTNCTSLALTSLPSGVTSIGNQAFKGCTNLALTSLPSGATNVSYSAFEGCTNLALTSLPSGITTINNATFKGCTSLALTELPSGVTSLDQSAFEGCTNLAITYVNASIGQNAFKGCTGIPYLVLDCNGKTISGLAFSGTTFTDLVIVGDPNYSNANTFTGSSIEEVLNLGGGDVSGRGLGTATVQDYIDADGFIAPKSVTTYETVVDDSPTALLIALLPVIVGVGVLMIAVGTMIYNRF